MALEVLVVQALPFGRRQHLPRDSESILQVPYLVIRVARAAVAPRRDEDLCKQVGPVSRRVRPRHYTISHTGRLDSSVAPSHRDRVRGGIPPAPEKRLMTRG